MAKMGGTTKGAPFNTAKEPTLTTQTTPARLLPTEPRPGVAAFTPDEEAEQRANQVFNFEARYWATVDAARQATREAERERDDALREAYGDHMRAPTWAELENLQDDNQHLFAKNLALITERDTLTQQLGEARAAYAERDNQWRRALGRAHCSSPPDPTEDAAVIMELLADARAAYGHVKQHEAELSEQLAARTAELEEWKAGEACHTVTACGWVCKLHRVVHHPKSLPKLSNPFALPSCPECGAMMMRLCWLELKEAEQQRDGFKASVDPWREHAEAADAEVAALRLQVETLRAALDRIATCAVVSEGYVVTIARDALAAVA